MFVLKMLGKEDDLAAVIGIVPHLPVDGLHYGMRLAANRNRAVHVGLTERFDRGEQLIPALLPKFHESSARSWRVFELAITIPIRLLAIASEKIHPTRPHVAGHMLDDDRDGVGLSVQHRQKLLIGHLFHGALREFLVVAK